MIDKFLLKFFGFFDKVAERIDAVLTFDFNNITTMFKCKRPCCKDKEKAKNNKYFKG
jgi:hypothetical protein|tara:strand:- start:406 stop:576 length:171 start_codon:yes stop_codon:yes gene_type:complete